MIKQKSIYDGSLPLAEKVDGKMKKIYINDGEGIVGMVRAIYNDSSTFSHYQRLYYLYDSLGSVSAVTGENGLPLQNYTYTPYGTCLNVTDDSINNLQFVGRYGGYKDSDTGLTYFWHRWYDSYDGRWVSRDPINIIDGKNLYQYVRNRSTYYIDSNGLCPDEGGFPRRILPTPANPLLIPKPIPIKCDNKEPYKECYNSCMIVVYMGCGLAAFVVDIMLGGLNPSGIAGGLITNILCISNGDKACGEACINATQ